MNKIFLSALVIVASTMLFASSAFAFDDPPTRAARLSFVKGDVSLQPGDADEWTWASLNRPLTTGDNIWVSRRGRAEIRIGSAALRADQKTSLSILNLDDDAAQFGLNSGTIIVHLRSLPADSYFEIDTPNAAVSLLRAGDYRIETEESGDFTRVAVRTGKAEVSGAEESFRISQGSEAEITGSDRLNYDVYDLSPSDEFDRWSRQRDWRAARSVSSRYVSTELTGYEDLDQNGRWAQDPTYGAVWQPTNVSSSWTPYREGRWAWVEPWGWTWMDDAPWGYATSHYGRWAYATGTRRWCWVPPQRNNTAYRWPVYSPANVVFIRETRVVYRDRPVIAWFPLGPGEAYVPAYRSSRDYLARMNGTNTYIRDYDRYDYNQRRYVSQRDYSNALIAGAVVAVASEIFSSARPVQRSTVQVSPAVFMSKEVARTAPIAPVKASVMAASATTAAAATAPAPAPPPEMTNRRVIAKEAPPPRRVKFDRKQAALQKNEGAPVDSDAEKTLRAATPAPAPAVVTVQAPATQAPPPEVSPKERKDQSRADRMEARQKRDAERQADRAEADKLRAEEEAQRKAGQDQKQQDADTARQQRDADRDAAKAQAEQQRADEAAARKTEQAEKQKEADEARQQQEEQRKAQKEQADQQRQQQDEQRKAQKEQADQQRQREEEQRKAEKDQADQQRQREEDQRKAEKAQADQQRQLQEEQRKAEKEQADQQRQREEEQRKAEKDQADQVRQQQQEQMKADKEQQRQQEEAQKKAEQEQRQQQADEARKAREDARKAREEQQQSGSEDQQAAPDQPAQQEAAPDDQQTRRHSGRMPRRPVEEPAPDEGAAASPAQQGETQAPPASGPVQVDAGTAAQNLISQPKLRYPRAAEQAGVEGTVKVQAIIGADGRVKNATAVEGPEELKEAATENVQRRRYQPTVVNGKPVEVQTDVSVDFQKPK